MTGTEEIGYKEENRELADRLKTVVPPGFCEAAVADRYLEATGYSVDQGEVQKIWWGEVGKTILSLLAKGWDQPIIFGGVEEKDTTSKESLIRTCSGMFFPKGAAKIFFPENASRADEGVFILFIYGRNRPLLLSLHRGEEGSFCYGETSKDQALDIFEKWKRETTKR